MRSHRRRSDKMKRGPPPKRQPPSHASPTSEPRPSSSQDTSEVHLTRENSLASVVADATWKVSVFRFSLELLVICAPAWSVDPGKIELLELLVFCLLWPNIFFEMCDHLVQKWVNRRYGNR